MSLNFPILDPSESIVAPGTIPCNKNATHKRYWKGFWKNCRENDSVEFCCNQVSCKNPHEIGIPCSVKKRRRTPRFGSLNTAPYAAIQAAQGLSSSGPSLSDESKMMWLGVR